MGDGVAAAEVGSKSAATDAPIAVEVWRGDEEGSFQRFEIHDVNQTILDVVTEIQRRFEPSLAYRFACRVGMCGSCAMRVNGRPRWTCRTRVGVVRDEGAVLRLEPLANFPIVRDLAVDMAGFFDKWQRSMGYFDAGPEPAAEFAKVIPQSAARREADAGIECINCGICHSACDVVAWDEAYAGPAALNRAWTLVNDVRDAAGDERLKAVSGDGGCQSCHSHMSCTTYCPKSLAPTYAIAGLKRASARRALRGWR